MRQDAELTPNQSVVQLENSAVVVVVRPDLGARLDRLFDKRTRHDWLWHPPQYDAQSRSLEIGASFDQHWTGGWDEIFPNDAAGEFQNRQLVDHGEFWSQAWQVLKQSPFQIKLELICKTVPVKVEKTIQLDETKPEVQLSYLFENLSSEPISFLFKQHAAIAIEPDDEILLPDCSIEPVELGFSRMIGRAGKTKFPTAIDKNGQETELNRTPDRSSQLQEFYYSSDLAIGQCGVHNARSHSSLMMNFDLNDFPYVWMFQSFGGWRDYYVLVIEPCTTLPYDLEIAARNGTIATLQPHQKQQRQLTVTLKQD